MPITQIVQPCHLLPKVPSGAVNPLWIRGQTMASANSFYLNRYLDLRNFDQYRVHQ